MTPKNSKRSVCPVACTLDLLGDKWTLLVVRDLFAGKSHFKEFKASPERIATNILSDRLTRLLDHDLIEQFPSKEYPGRFAYRLTKKGRTLRKPLEAVAQWGLANIAGTEIRVQPKG